MNLTKSLVLFFALFIILNSCSSLGDVGKVMRNEKTNSTDEFLIQKKDPLTRPPDFRTLPTPNSRSEKREKENNIDSIFSNSKKVIPDGKNSSIEQSILKKIK